MVPVRLVSCCLRTDPEKSKEEPCREERGIGLGRERERGESYYTTAIIYRCVCVYIYVYKIREELI